MYVVTAESRLHISCNQLHKQVRSLGALFQVGNLKTAQILNMLLPILSLFFALEHKLPV